jgi:flagellin
MLKDQINAVADRTGVIASYDINGRLVLKASDGRNIEVVVSDAAASAATGLTTMVATAKIELSSQEQYDISGANTGFIGTADRIVGVDSLQSIDSVNTESREASNHAITIVDRALEQVSKDRSALGALQNRLVSTVNNLSNVVENASASRSRIMDADFAAESANLARGQVLQQAGVSILAQANQGPNLALSLLG